MALFREADTNGNKEVDMEELQDALARHEDGPELAQGNGFRLAQVLDGKMPSAKDIMELFDRNGDGAIQQEEYLDTLMAIAEEHDYKPTKGDKRMAMALFREADQNNNGEIDKEELLDAMARLEDEPRLAQGNGFRLA